MLVHLVHNKQLKKPTKRYQPTTFLLVDNQGVVYEPVCLTITSPLVKGAPLASFELNLPQGGASILTMAKTFDELVDYFNDQFIPAIAPKDIQKILRSQSLTIKYVVEQLKIPRPDAKEFIERCVSVGAFKKYYSYWIRTDIFTSWVSQQGEK